MTFCFNYGLYSHKDRLPNIAFSNIFWSIGRLIKIYPEFFWGSRSGRRRVSSGGLTQILVWVGGALLPYEGRRAGSQAVAERGALCPGQPCRAAPLPTRTPPPPQKKKLYMLSTGLNQDSFIWELHRGGRRERLFKTTFDGNIPIKMEATRRGSWRLRRAPASSPHLLRSFKGVFVYFFFLNCNYSHGWRTHPVG